jgi:hypothetical protein
MENFTKQQLEYHKTYIFKSRNNKRLFFEALPDIFSLKEAVEVGLKFHMQSRTVSSVLSSCMPYLIKQPRYGLYEKVESKSEYITHHYSEDELNIIASDLKANVPVKRIARVRGEQFGRKGDGMLKKIRQIKRSLQKGFTVEDVINKRTTERYNKQTEETMSAFNFYSQEEIAIMKVDIATGEPIKQIARRLAKEFKRPAPGLEQKLYTLKKSVPVIHTWNGPKFKKSAVKKVVNVPVEQKQPADIGIEVPDGMTFEGKPKRIMLHSDHFRIYF